MILHPATVLLVWGGLVVLLQSLGVAELAGVALVALPLSFALAPYRAMTLIRRARWLLLSIAFLFAFATPGERLPGLWGDAGLTYDGLQQAAEHLLRLVLLLATLALVHDRLGNDGMIAGLHWLLAPLAAVHGLRERLVVRLTLVLDYVERPPAGGWRTWLAGNAEGPDALELAIRKASTVDWCLVALMLVASIWWFWR